MQGKFFLIIYEYDKILMKEMWDGGCISSNIRVIKWKQLVVIFYVMEMEEFYFYPIYNCVENWNGSHVQGLLNRAYS